VNTCNEPKDETKFTGVPKMWHVHSSSEMAELQRNDPDIGPVSKLRLQSEEQPSFDMIRDRSVNTKHYWSQWPRLVIRKGVVYRTAFNRRGQPEGLQLLVPISLRNELMDIVHTGLIGSHVSMEKQ